MDNKNVYMQRKAKHKASVLMYLLAFLAYISVFLLSSDRCLCEELYKLAPETLFTGKKTLDLSVGKYRDPDKVFDEEYGKQQYEKIDHRIAHAVIGTSLDSIMRAVEFIEEEGSNYPPQHKPTDRIIVAIPRDNAELKRQLPPEYKNKCIYVYYNADEITDLMLLLRDKSHIEYNATILTVISDQTEYTKGDLEKNIRSLIYHKKPSVVVSAVKGEKPLASMMRPVDLTYFTDAHYVRERDAGFSFYEQIAPYIVLSRYDKAGYGVTVDGSGDQLIRNSDNWNRSSYATTPLEPVSDDPARIHFPERSKVLFFEPHQDDYVLASCNLIRHLLLKRNILEVTHFHSTHENDYWPTVDKVRDSENRMALHRIYDDVSKFCKMAIPISYTTVDITRGGEDAIDKISRQKEVFDIIQKLEDVNPEVIVLPSSEDTHRHHVRLRELVLDAAQRYVQKTGKSLRVYSVPLFSAEESAFVDVNRYIRQTDTDYAYKRKALESFSSQYEYVEGDSYRAWRKRCIERTQDMFDMDEPPPHPYDFFKVEEITSKDPAKREDRDGVLRVETGDDNRLKLLYYEKGREYTILYRVKDNGLTLLVDEREQKGTPYRILERISDRLLKDISIRDKTKATYIVRTVYEDGNSYEPLDWLVSRLEKYGNIENIPESDGENVLLSLKVLFERINSEVEERKIKEEIFKRGPTLADSRVYERNSSANQKLIIGMASHKSHEIIGKRLQNITEQIKNLDPKWGHWKIEIVICINGKPEEIDEMAAETISQIPRDIFSGIPNPVKVVIIKEDNANQSNAINKIYNYAKANDGTIVTMTDDDVHFERDTLLGMIDKLLSYHEKVFVGARFHWRRRTAEELLYEAKAELNGNSLTALLPKTVKAVLADIISLYKKLWQEIAIFRRRVDIDYSPKVIMGAATTTWASRLMLLPYWIRQTDVWWRYRYSPYTVLLDEEGTRASSVAARGLAYYFAKRPRTYYGYRDDINRIFSDKRRDLQKDEDVYYDENVKTKYAHVKLPSFKDWIYLQLNLLLHRFSDWLFDKFEFVYNSPRFTWSLSERGADSELLEPKECLVSYDKIIKAEPWRMLEIISGELVFYDQVDGKKGVSMDVYEHPSEYTGEAEKAREAEFMSALTRALEACTVDENGIPKISDGQIEELAYRLFALPMGKNKTMTLLRNVIRVFADIYAVPDMRASEIILKHDLKKDQIVAIYTFIRQCSSLQQILLQHPVHKNFIDRMRGLLTYPMHTRRLIERRAVFPLDIEMHPSVKCNSRCVFCYNKDHWNYNDEIKIEGLAPLDVKEWKKIVDECASNNLRRLYIVGGLEPLFSTDKSLEIMRYAKERGIQVKLFTNGINIDPNDEDMINTLVSIDQVFVSIRGATPMTYSKATGTSVKTFKKVVNNMKHLVAEKIKQGSHVDIGMAYVVHAINYRELPELMDLAEEVGVDTVGLSTDNVRGMLNFSEDQKRELQHLLSAVMAASDIKVGRFKDLNIALNDVLTLLSYTYGKDSVPEIYNYKLRPAKECRMWFMRPVVDPFGKVYHCCLLAQPGVVSEELGRVRRKGGLANVLDDVKDHVHRVSDCASCNPSETNALIAIEKLKSDLDAGISFQMQPYKVTIVKSGPTTIEPGSEKKQTERAAKALIAVKDLLPPAAIQKQLVEYQNIMTRAVESSM